MKKPQKKNRRPKFGAFPKTERHERRLWVFTCITCAKHRRQTFFRRICELGICRRCRTGQVVNPNQGALFAPEKQQNEP